MKKPTFKRPSFKRPKTGPKLAHETKAADPLKDLPDVDDPQESTELEVTALQAGFRERAAQEAARFGEVTAGGYYIVLVFVNEDQADAWADASGVDHKGEAFLDGRELARKMGIELPPATAKVSKPNVNKKYAALVDESPKRRD